MSRTSRFVLLALALSACGDPAPGEADGSVDASRDDADASGTDSGPRPDGARPDVDAGPVPGACPPITIEHGASVDGYLSDVFTWRDARCRPRTAVMVRNDATDPAGSNGGYMRRYAYQLDDGTTRTCDGSSERHSGFGYTVTHFGETSSSSRDVRGTYRTVLEGAHHAIHEYHWDAVPIDGHGVDVTIRWTFATGRDHPLWAITYDLTGVPADAVTADTRSPYGDMQWDGGEGAEVDGVGWGDRYRFRSLDAPVDLSSGWDYSQANTIPHVIEWSASADAEMGLVQTQTSTQHDAGGYWFYSAWGTRDDDGPMPEDWNWTYQLNQYELPFVRTSKRMAWGSNYGAVGQRMYLAYGDDRQLSGWPYQSYAVFIVLDRHALAPVDAQVRWMEAVQSTAITATVGTVLTEGPSGVGRTDTAAYAPAGWDPIHAAFAIESRNGAMLHLDTGAATLARPTFRITSWAGLFEELILDGVRLVRDVDYYASIEDSAGTSPILWITLARDLHGAADLEVVEWVE